jgi:hypothetical protein
MKRWIELWGHRLRSLAAGLIAAGAIGAAIWLVDLLLIRLAYRLLPQQTAHWIVRNLLFELPVVACLAALVSYFFVGTLSMPPRSGAGSSSSTEIVQPGSAQREKLPEERLEKPVTVRPDLRMPLREPEAEYVNIEILDTTERPFRALGLNEGLYAGLVYKLVVNMGLTPDLRFSGKRQEPIERPEMDEVNLDVVLALPVNIEIIGSSWAVLRWPTSGPSTVNAEFEIRAPLAADGRLKLLIFHEHDLLFCGDIAIKVETETFDWPITEQPIRWLALGEAQAFELSLFRRFRDLDRDRRRRLNISVHRRSGDEYDLLFFLRSTEGRPAVYPLRLVVPNDEIIQWLAKTRAAMRLLVDDATFRKVSAEAPEYSGKYRSVAQGASPNEAIAYNNAQKLLRDMAVVGHELWARMFGSEMGQRMGARLAKELGEDGITIQVWISDTAEDFVLPWVWLYSPGVEGGVENVDRKSFWGYRYVIEQVRHRPKATRPESSVRADPLRVSGAIHNFATASRQRAFFDSYKHQYPTFEWREVAPSDLGAALREFESNIFYLYCHGHTEKAFDQGYLDTLAAWGKCTAAEDKEDSAFMLEFVNTQRRKKIRDHSYIQIENIMLKLSDLRLFKPADPTVAPLVFLNMCESAEFYPGATDNLVDVFLERGARGVIGTEMPMLTVFGDLMARQFFELYLSPDPGHDGSEGQTIGRVLWLLRRRFLDRGNPLAFAYTYFGDAMTRLRPAVIQGTATPESANSV